MAATTHLSDLAVNVQADAFASLMDGGFIDIFDGKQPKDAATPLSGQKLGVTFGFGSPAFARAAAGLIVANPITPGVARSSLNPATWARIYRADHKTAVMDVTVGTKNAVIVLPTVTLPEGVTVTCSFFSHVIPKST